MDRNIDNNVDNNIIQTEYSELMQKSYIDYAMSVIIARALPDVRDGLKPVQRRTLYDMHELGIRYDKPYRKSARIVGDTMGKYHPHGDSSIYDAMVVLAQDFKKGMPLIDGHGNFGSIEGDGAAAMRYTEARLQKITQEAYLADLDKNVVDFIPNYDETEKEPEVLPVKVPNLLINGAEGIAVGMATSIPPHNFGEVVDGVIAYMKNPDITTAEMMQYIKGPDFPTGGIVANQDDLAAIYETGQGKIKIRGRIEIEKGKAGKDKLVITEIPYTMIGANIGKFLNDVYSLVESKATTDIVDITNQSSKEGIRIVLELKKGADVEALKNLLYKKTKLEDTFGVNMLAVANGRPETLGLVPIIRHHVNFQYEIAKRKYETLLAKEQEKEEIQQGLIKACNVIDLIIEILRGSRDQKMAKACLINGETEGIKFKSKASEAMAAQLCFTERQAAAILEMRLYKLIGLEIEALIKEHEETRAKIAEYSDILEHRSSMAKVIMKELKAFRKEYARDRRTELDNLEEAVVVKKELEVSDVVLLMDRFGYVKTVDTSTYDRNKDTADAENKLILKVKNIDKLCIFTNNGNMHLVKVLDLPIHYFLWRYKTISELMINEQIRDREVRLIGADGEQLGIVSSREAQKIADEAGLDLVKIAPNAKPPVCKVIDYGKYRYEQARKEKDAKKKQKTVELKEIRLSPNIEANDLNTKMNAAKKFLAKGNKVKITLRFRGREMAHMNASKHILDDIAGNLSDVAVVEKAPKVEGRSIGMVLAEKR